MNIGHECERQGPEGDGHGSVPCRWPRCVTKSKVLIGYVGREHYGTDDKGGQPPKRSHLIGRSRPGKSGGSETNAEVEHAGEYHSAQPSLAERVFHTFGLTRSIISSNLDQVLIRIIHVKSWSRTSGTRLNSGPLLLPTASYASPY